MCFDGDGAGKKATLRSLDILVSAGLDVYVASMPAGVDPDEYVLANGVESYKQLIAEAKYWVEYLIREYSLKYNLKRAEERNLFVASALNVIKKLQSNTEQNVYLELVKSLSNISMDVLKRDLENIDNVKLEEAKPAEKEDNMITKENAYVKAVKFVVGALLHKKEYACLDEDIKDNLLDPDLQKLYAYLQECKETGKTPIISHVFDLFNVETNPVINDIVNYNFTDIIDNQGYYNDCVKLLVRSGLEMKQKELANKISLESDIDKRSQIILKQNALKKK